MSLRLLVRAEFTLKTRESMRFRNLDFLVRYPYNHCVVSNVAGFGADGNESLRAGRVRFALPVAARVACRRRVADARAGRRARGHLAGERGQAPLDSEQSRAGDFDARHEG